MSIILLTTVGTCPGMTGWPGPIPICCISAFFKAKWFLPFINSWSFRCCGGWKYLHGGFSRLQRPYYTRIRKKQTINHKSLAIDSLFAFYILSKQIETITVRRQSMALYIKKTNQIVFDTSNMHIRIARPICWRQIADTITYSTEERTCFVVISCNTQYGQHLNRYCSKMNE